MARPFTTLSLCSGVGWLDEGVRAACEYLGWGHCVAAYCEWEAYAASVLMARMEESSLEPAPVWCGDLGDFDGRHFRGAVDGVVAGLPCQPYSLAGKRLGNSDRRSYGDGDGPIPHALRIISECQPSVVFFENVPAWVRGGWFRPVGEELCGMGYTLAEPLFVTAESVGASHRRERAFVMAYRERAVSWTGTVQTASPGKRRHRPSIACDSVAVARSVQRRFGESRRGPDRRTAAGGAGDELAQPVVSRLERRVGAVMAGPRDGGHDADAGGSGAGLFAPGPSGEWSGVPEWLWPATQPGVRVLVDGSAMVVDESRADQLRCSGNGVVALCAAAAFVELVRSLRQFGTGTME